MENNKSANHCKPIIMTMVDHYLPGYRAGGPSRTIANLVEWLGDELQFKIITADRDYDENKPYENIPVGEWVRVGKAEVMYLRRSRFGLHGMLGVLTGEDYDILFLNSYFSFHCTITALLYRRLGKIPGKPVLMAPRGEFADSALRMKWLKKTIFLHIANRLGLYRDVTWLATSPHEYEDICRTVVGEKKVYQVPNLPRTRPAYHLNAPAPLERPITNDMVRIVGLGRISGMKNVDFAIKAMQHVSRPVQFDWYGPVGDELVWEECKRLLVGLPNNVKFTFCGELSTEKVIERLSEYDLFFMPSKGENFGHAIIEAMMAGCPVLISDKTPWRDLAKQGLGWDLPLTSPGLFAMAIEAYVALPVDEKNRMRQRVQAFGKKYAEEPEGLEPTRELFRTMV